MNQADEAREEKVAPETMVLRGSPARVTRFRREVVIGGAILGSTLLAGTAWYALRPGTAPLVTRPELAVEQDGRRLSDAIAGAPASYDEVPRLGPPLPGDLGRPLLRAQRRGEPASPSSFDSGRSPPPIERPDVQAERMAAARRTARESSLLVSLKADRSSRTDSPALQPGNASPEIVPTQVAPSETAASRPSMPGGDRLPTALLAAGSVIAASLITGINSDAPGMVTAQVTQGVYDSPTGRTLLIPQGARLVGTYGSSATFGQSRALVIWSRLILPDGSSVELGDLPASDAGGYAGLSDRVDRHTGRLLKGVALASLLGMGTEVSIGGDGDLVRAIREATQQSAARAGDQIVAKELGVAPTLTVRPGWPVRALVNKDLNLVPWRDAR